MDQCGGLQRVIRALARKIVPCQAVQRVVHEGHQLLPRLRIAVGPCAEQPGDTVGVGSHIRRRALLMTFYLTRPAARRLTITNSASSASSA